MALNIYHEARGEPLLGQVAVGTLTMNRAKWDAKNVCPVVYAPKQFSWTSLQKNSTQHPPAHDESWQSAKYLARGIVNGKFKDVTEGAVFFHSYTAEPEWRHSYRQTVVIGNHIFYAKR